MRVASGGGVRAEFTSCTFEENSSTAGSAGAVEAHGLKNVTFDNCTFTRNYAAEVQ